MWLSELIMRWTPYHIVFVVLVLQSCLLSDETGGISGSVTLIGRPPEPREKSKLFGSEIGGIPFIAVYVENQRRADASKTDHADRIALSYARGFSPPVGIARSPFELRISNEEKHVIVFQVLGFEQEATLFKVDPGMTKTVTIRERHRGIIQIKDVTNSRFAWVFCIHDGAGVVTDADGNYLIEGLTPGVYDLRFWHPFLEFPKDVQKHNLEVSAGKTLSVEDLEITLKNLK